MINGAVAWTGYTCTCMYESHNLSNRKLKPNTSDDCIGFFMGSVRCIWYCSTFSSASYKGAASPAMKLFWGGRCAEMCVIWEPWHVLIVMTCLHDDWGVHQQVPHLVGIAQCHDAGVCIEVDDPMLNGFICFCSLGLLCDASSRVGPGSPNQWGNSKFKSTNSLSISLLQPRKRNEPLEYS